MKNKILLLLSAALLALATSARADLTINFQDLPVGYSFGSFANSVLYNGLFFFPFSGGENIVTPSGLQIGAGVTLEIQSGLAYTPDLADSLVVNSITISTTSTLEVSGLEIEHENNGNVDYYPTPTQDLPSGTYQDPFDGKPLIDFVFYNDSSEPATINSITMDLIPAPTLNNLPAPAPEPSQLVSGLALATLGGLGFVVRRFRNRQ